MSLPYGFQPRPCPFCGGRSHHNDLRPDGRFRVMCLFCESIGPAANDNDGAWLAWNGQGMKSSQAQVIGEGFIL